MINLIKKFWSEEEGQGMAEYGLILALVAVAAITVLTTMGDKLTSIFSEVNSNLTTSSN
ncbi:MAG: Flp family type IVb pilin [Clostridiales bacterium]|nr:Flp family type IVb pilin [Clostridiales bacterium]MCF8023048.1 Flp family type IVb pilin [Clostridiales bacterium]